mmetsp:Transcript_25590/g.39607  ORF Transcript_25590/g.39607 Transcript_25590/m.39607 type:complete len:80 (+) Transcript_25590:45-284(+)
MIKNENLSLKLMNFTLVRYFMMNSGAVCVLPDELFGTKSFLSGYDRVVSCDEFVFENYTEYSTTKSIFSIQKTLPLLAF